MQPLTPEHVQAALADAGLDIELMFFDSSTATSQQAADNIGCELGQIAKSVAFIADGDPVLVIASGDRRVHDKKLADLRGISRKRVKIAKPQQCIELYGYAPGAIPPLGHRTAGIPVYFDDSLRRYDLVYGAGGAANAIFPIQLEQLVRVTNGIVSDLSRD